MGCGELLLLSEVCDLSTDLAVNVDQRCRNELLLNLDIGIVEAATSKSRKGTNGVLEVGDFLCLCRLAKVSALGAKSDERSNWMSVENIERKFWLNLRCRSVGDLVGDNINTLVSGNSLHYVRPDLIRLSDYTYNHGILRAEIKSYYTHGGSGLD